MIDFNKQHDINIFINDMWQKYAGDLSKLQGDLNFPTDQLEREVNLHKATSSTESPSNINVIKFVSDLRQVSGFFPGTLVFFTNKTDCHDIQCTCTMYNM